MIKDISEGTAFLGDDDFLIIKTHGKKIRLEILTDDSAYKVRETGMAENYLELDTPANTDGWNTVNDDIWRTVSTSLIFDGITTAIMIFSKTGNTDLVEVHWRIDK